MRRLFSEVEGDDIDEGEDKEEAGEAAEEHKIHLKIQIWENILNLAFNTDL